MANTSNKSKPMLVQIPLKISLRDDASFKTFVAANEAMEQVVANLLQPDLVVPACYYFYGADGIGKTHILQASCRHYTEQQLTSVYFPLADSSLPLIPDVLPGLESTDLVCLDDVGQIIGDEYWEKALMNLLAKSRVQGKKILLAGNLPIEEINFKTHGLTKEFFNVVPIAFQRLEQQKDLVSALQKHAVYAGFDLSVDVGNFLYRQFGADLAVLLAKLKILEQATLAEKRRLTLPFAKKVLEA